MLLTLWGVFLGVDAPNCYLNELDSCLNRDVKRKLWIEWNEAIDFCCWNDNDNNKNKNA